MLVLALVCKLELILKCTLCDKVWQRCGWPVPSGESRIRSAEENVKNLHTLALPEDLKPRMLLRRDVGANAKSQGDF